MSSSLLVAAAAATAQAPQTVWEFLASGGELMVPIGLCSVLVVAFAFERWLSLHYRRLAPIELDDALDHVAGGRVDQARAVARDLNAPAARILLAGLRRHGFSIRDVEGAMEDQAHKELEKLRKNIRPIALIAGIAPLLGLLGTVVGIAEAFHRVVDAGMGKPEVLAAGIEVALTTTIAGLLVAIPAMVIAAWLNAKVRRLLLRVDELLAPAVEQLAARPVTEGEHAA